MKQSTFKLPPARSDLPPDVREALINLLAEALVADYQANPAVGEPTVVEGSLCDRGSEADSRAEKG